MMTRDGLLTALEAVLELPIEVVLFVNELDGDNVNLSDIEEARNYKRQTLKREQWKIDEENLQATSARVPFVFTGRAGKVVGYALVARGRVVTYETFMDPVPINTNEDKLGIYAKIRAEALAS